MKNQFYIVICLYFLSQGINCECDCGQGAVFNQNTETCQHYPKSASDTGYIANCIEYNSGNIFSNGLGCSKCEDGYEKQIGQDVCEKITIADCIQAHFGGAKCLKCKEGKLVDQGQTLCVSNPGSGDTGFVQDCSIYKYSLFGGDLSCQGCIEGKYVSQNECVDNPQSGGSGFIQDCLEYEKVNSGLECKVCNEGSFINGQCMSFSSLNCLEGDDISCLKCKEGYFVQKTSSGICSQNPQQGENKYTENCGKYQDDIIDGVKCIYCIPGYYIDDSDGSCKQADQKFTTCSIVGKMQTGYSCAGCIDGYHLGKSMTEVCSVCPQKIQPTKQPGNSEANLLRYCASIIIALICLVI